MRRTDCIFIHQIYANLVSSGAQMNKYAIDREKEGQMRERLTDSVEKLRERIEILSLSFRNFTVTRAQKRGKVAEDCLLMLCQIVFFLLNA